MKILNLVTGTPSKYLKQALDERGHTYDTIDARDTYLFTSESVNGYDRIYNGTSNLDAPIRLVAQSYDAVISRIGTQLPLCVSTLRHLTENLGIYCPQTSIGLLMAHDKLWTTQALSFNGVRTPLTVFAIRPNHVPFLIEKSGGLPVVAKQLTGSQGAGVSILETPLSTNTTLESFTKAGIPVKLQRFVKAHTNAVGSATDIRAIVVGERVVIAMERTANSGDFRANLSKGGSGRKIELSDEEIKMCINAAKSVKLEFAGVDLIREQAGKTFVTEVNGNPGTGIIDITGHNYFVDLVKHIEAKTGNTSQEPSKEQKPQNKPTDTGKSEEEARISEYHRLKAKQAKAGLNLTEHARLAWLQAHVNWWK